MSKEIQGVKASQVLQDGALRQIQGLGQSTKRADQAPFLIESEQLDFFDGSVKKSAPIPFDYEVVGAILGVYETLGTAASTIIIGTAADTDHFVESTVVPTTTAPFGQELTLTATVTGSKGDCIVFTSGNGATSTGLGKVTLVVVPRNG